MREMEKQRDLQNIFKHLQGDSAYEIPGGGESMQSFFDRAANALDEIAMANLGGRILLVTHGGFLYNCFRYVHNFPPGHQIVRLGICTPLRNTSICSLEYNVPGEKNIHSPSWKMMTWASNDHLSTQAQVDVMQ